MSAKKSRVITLPLPPSLLSRFPSTSSAKSTPPIIKGESAGAAPTLAQPSPSDPKSSESNATPVPTTIDTNSLAPPKIDGRRKRGGAAGGASQPRKRAPPSIDPNGAPRERARPGPKKKPRLADGTIDHTTPSNPTNPNAAARAAVPASRLGPKANTGAINAGLRALDRTGKPCRKWERKGMVLKSFTGTVWGMPSWKAPPKEVGFSGDVKSDSGSSSEQLQNGKLVQGSSRVGSEGRSSENGGGGDTIMTGVESSPVRQLGGV